jgi:AmmeMemoRadiSam system protein A
LVEKLSETDKTELLKIAKKAISSAVRGQAPDKINLDSSSAELQAEGASFVTLTKDGKLRGCIGTLEAYQPLVMDVQEHAIAAAQEDYRFNPVSIDEIESLKIEISHLTTLRKLDYKENNDLVSKLRPGIDGVLIKDGLRRATFLPQVWNQISNGKEFLSHLCMKMGALPDLWQKKQLEVFIYQVEEFSED